MTRSEESRGGMGRGSRGREERQSAKETIAHCRKGDGRREGKGNALKWLRKRTELKMCTLFREEREENGIWTIWE